MNTKDLFKNELEKVDNDVKIEIDLSFQITDKISSILKSKGVNQKEFAEKIQKSEAEISRWVGGTHNFTIKTIAKISDVLEEQIIQVIG